MRVPPSLRRSGPLRPRPVVVNEVQRYGYAELTGWCRSTLAACGVPEEEAGLAADVLVQTDARGYHTHGLSRIPSYLDRITSGEVCATARIDERREDGLTVFDAHFALGQVSGPRIIDRLVERTREAPFALSILRDNGHLGALGILVLRAAQMGRVALMLQATPPVIGLPGATGPMLGNNPIALAAPRPGGDPIVVDMACSVAARGNIILAAKAGRPIPEGWAMDAAGQPTTDAAAALDGVLLPFGGHKGMMLSVIVEVLAGSLSGRAFRDSLGGAGASGGPGGLNALLLVLNPDLTTGRAAYEGHVAAWVQHFKNNGGPSARLPGERAALAEREARRLGVPLAGDVTAPLVRLGRERSLPFPDPA